MALFSLTLQLSDRQLARLDPLFLGLLSRLETIADRNKEGFAKVAEAISSITEPEPLRPHGYARVVTDEGFTAEGDISMSRITTSGWAEFKFQPTDRRGNPTDRYQKGTANHVIVNDDGTLATIVASLLEPENELAFRVNAVGKPGAVQLLSSVDGDPSEDERLIEASGAVEIVPGDAVRGTLAEGSVGEQES